MIAPWTDDRIYRRKMYEGETANDEDLRACF